MPVNIDSSMTFSEMIIELADDVGLASHGADGRSAAGLPDNPADLAKVKKFVNKGYRAFLGEDPKWTFCRSTFTLVLYPAGDGPDNVDGDAARYRLPSYLRGMPATTPTYTDQLSRVTHCLPRDVATVLRHIQTEEATGVPRIYAVRPIPGPDGKTSHVDTLHEMLFYPTPDVQYTLEMQVRVHPYNLVDVDLERHVAGPEHDRAIMAAARLAWLEAFSEDAGEKAEALQTYTKLLENAKAVDRELRPRNLGRLSDPSINRAEPVRRGRGLITHSNGTPIF